MWTIYDHPGDYPDKFVVRKFIVGTSLIATQEVIVGATLDEVRDLIPPGLVCLTRSPDDDPVIVETWF